MGQKPVPSRFKSLEKLVFFPKICPYFALDVERSDDAQDLIRLYGCKGLSSPSDRLPAQSALQGTRFAISFGSDVRGVGAGAQMT